MDPKGNASDLLPRGEGIRKALIWLSSRREQEPGAPLYRLIEEAALRFDLSPSEVESLKANLGVAH